MGVEVLRLLAGHCLFVKDEANLWFGILDKEGVQRDGRRSVWLMACGNTVQACACGSHVPLMESTFKHSLIEQNKQFFSVLLWLSSGCFNTKSS